LHYDADSDGKISSAEYIQAGKDWNAGKITEKEYAFVGRVYFTDATSINKLCPECY